jgi:pyruvate formate lyase activating enzyme
MRIGGVVKQNTGDFPEGTAAFIYLKGCNFRCSFCRSLILTQTDMLNRTVDLSEQVVFDFLRLNKNNISGVVVTGGEPTMQKALPSFLMQIKGMGFKIKIKTNGTNSEMLSKIIRLGLVDYVMMDVKAALCSESYEKIAGVACDELIDNVLKSILLIKDSGIKHEFFTVVLPGIHTDEDIEDLKSILKGSKYALQKVKVEENEAAVI